jgi:hypothetical protein
MSERGYKTYLFELSPKAFQGNGPGVGILNGGVYLDTKLRNRERCEDGGMSVKVKIPDWERAHEPEYLPSSGEMISDHDLWMSHLLCWFAQAAPYIEGIKPAQTVEDFRVDCGDYEDIPSKAGLL